MCSFLRRRKLENIVMNLLHSTFFYNLLNINSKCQLNQQLFNAYFIRYKRYSGWEKNRVFCFIIFATQLIRNVLIVNAMLAMMKGISKEKETKNKRDHSLLCSNLELISSFISN